MPILQIVKVALKSLKTNKVRTLLTMLGIIIGVTSVILLVSIGSGLQSYITKQLEGIGSNLVMVMPGKVNFEGFSGGGPGANMMNSKLEVRDAKALVEGSQFIIAAIPGTAAQTTIKYNEEKMYIEVNGGTYNFNDVINSPLSAGDYFTESDERSAKKVVIIGSEISKTLFGDSDPLGEKVMIGDNRFTVIGVLKDRGVGGNSSQDSVAVPITVAQRIFNQEKIHLIYAKASGPDKIDQAVEEAKLILGNRLKEDDFTIMTQKDLLRSISSIMGVLTTALAGIAAISLFVGGIGIMNIMLVSVTERTREIGLRKALGATPQIIMSQFLVEALILSVGGGVIGIIIGSSFSVLVNRFFPAQITPLAIILAFGVSTAVGVIFGVMPARRAANLNPIEALRYE